MIPVPLIVRLRTPQRDVYVTRELRDLTFGSGVPGGFRTCTVSLDRSLRLTPAEIAPYGQLYVYDGRSGVTVWEGRIEDPGRGSGGDGDVWTVTASGGAANTQDHTVPLIYVDTDLTAFARADNVTPGATAGNSDSPANPGVDALVFQFPQGLTVTTNSRGVLRYTRLAEARQKLAYYDYTWAVGGTGGWAVQGVTRTNSLGTGENSRSDSTAVSTTGASSPKDVDGDFPDGRDALDLRYIRTAAGSSTVATDTAWCAITNVTVRGMLYNADGTEKTTGYTTATVLAHEVVADVLGRLLGQCDGANAVLATNTYPIEQLAFPDGATAGQVLDELVALHADHFWAVWETTPAGKYRFEWTKWPTTVRYEATAADGLDSPGSTVELYDRVAVRWRDRRGRIRNTLRTQTVDVLTDAGLSRTATLDLSDISGTATNAAQAGDAFLAQHQSPPNAGTLTVNRPVYDSNAGRMVMPWELRPGNLIRVRDVAARADALNTGDRDGVTVFRVVGMTYSPSTGAVLELDSPPRNLAAIIAQARRDIARARRR